jgi:hypothetical protein
MLRSQRSVGPGVLKDLQTVFERYDSGRKSYLTRRELKLCMIACLGFKPPKVWRIVEFCR